MGVLMERSTSLPRITAEPLLAAFDTLPNPVLLVSRGHSVLYSNDIISRITEYSSDEIHLLPIEKLCPEYTEEWWNGSADFGNNSESDTFPLNLTSRSGKTHALKFQVSHLYLDKDEYLLLLGKSSELKDDFNEPAADRLDAVIKALPDLTFIIDEEGRHLDVMTSEDHLLYRSVQEIRGKLMHEIFDKTIADKFLTLVRETIESDSVRSIEYNLNIENQNRWYEARTAPLNPEFHENKAVIWIAREITDRKLAEFALRDSEARLRSIGNAVPDLIFVVDQDGTYLDVLTSDPELLYLKKEELIGVRIHDIFEQEEADRYLNAIQHTIETGESVSFEYDMQVQSGIHWFESRTGTMDVEIEGKKCGVFLARDITEKKQTAQALKESEERLSSILGAIPDLIFVIDEDGCYQEIMTTESNLLYEEAQQLKGKSFHDVFPKDKADLFLKAMQETIETGESELLEYELEVPAGKRWFEGRTGPMHLAINGNRCGIFIARDVTDRKRKEELQEQNIYLQEELLIARNYGEIIGDSDAMLDVFKHIDMVAETDSTVLLLGETGTGKELIARAIHSASERKSNAMIKVNCGAMPSGLVESELFGHEKGAFTGATDQKKGKFELADNGTIFLDEVGELPLDTQVKLLRVLQEQEFERVGGTETLHIDVRVIGATNRDLIEAVKEGSFRADLYYRLNIFPIIIPPLRERFEDIPLLVNYFINKFGKRIGKRITGVHPSAMKHLLHYNWPGNVRELANVMERAVIICQGKVIQPEHTGKLDKTLPDDDFFPTLEQAEQKHILSALEKTGGVLGGANGAAELLGVPRSTLWSRMKKLGIEQS
ncbi:MAG: PAS domain-containing protein [Candidatus Marinimicrobia bacterium]|nr:PAS domain-containing protein [Candidatus Neomarinimicrobiota bacterium]